MKLPHAAHLQGNPCHAVSTSSLRLELHCRSRIQGRSICNCTAAAAKHTPSSISRPDRRKIMDRAAARICLDHDALRPCTRSPPATLRRNKPEQSIPTAPGMKIRSARKEQMTAAAQMIMMAHAGPSGRNGLPMQRYNPDETHRHQSVKPVKDESGQLIAGHEFASESPPTRVQHQEKGCETDAIEYVCKHRHMQLRATSQTEPESSPAGQKYSPLSVMFVTP